ncbi:MAG: tetratricopeptide repeat protein, partial [Planctomycetaceae bacterium]|nr:tetratricopeptide repeat protein [Planctomycetaceae bacterium]
MAKRNFEEENEDEEVEVRKRRRPLKKPVAEEDDDDEVGRGGKNKNRNKNERDDDDDEDDNDLLPSTGFVLLDIVLDRWDDYVYWTKDHFLLGVIFGILGFIILFTPVLLVSIYIYNYSHRPTLQKAIDAYDYGAYGEAGRFAETVLKYAAKDDDLTRAGALFVLGASSCSIAEISGGNPNESPKKNYYLAAAKYLADCRELGYYPGRNAEASFMLGKSFYLAGEFVKAREPLLFALENDTPNKKMLYWFLANSHVLTPDINTAEAEKFIKLFQTEETTTEEEIFESNLFGAMIQIYNNKPDEAEQILRKVPQFDQYAVMKTFIKGQIAFLRANVIRQKLVNYQKQPNQNNTNPQPTIDTNSYPDPSLLPDNNTSFNKTQKSRSNHLNTQKNFPTGVVAANTIFEHVDKNSIYQRINYLAQTEPTDPVSPIDPALPFDAAAPSSEPFPPTPIVPPDVVSPDAVIMLPPEPSEPAARDAETNDEGFFPPSIMDSELIVPDPITSTAKQIKELAQQKYIEAIELFREVRMNDSFEKKWLRTAELLEGKCNEEIGEITEAKTRYSQINEIFAGTDEAAAADFFYAEIERGAGRFNDVLTIYDRAFETLRQNPDYACHWLTRKDIDQKAQEILQWLMRRRDYRNGIVFLSLARGIIGQADAARLRGEFYENWGKELYQQSQTQPELQPVGGERENGYIEKFRRAGDAFSEFARRQFGEKTYSIQVWRGAENYRLGKDNKHAIELYKVYLRVNKTERQAEALLYIGEMYINLAMIDQAIENLEMALSEYPRDALVSRIRLKLSYAYNEKREFDKARQLLISNLVEGSYDPSSVVYSDSVYLLAKLSYERGNTDDAIVYLEDALKIHPNAPQAAEAHYFVSRSYLTRADATLAMLKDAAQIREVREQIRDSVANDRGLALEHIQTTQSLLSRRRETRELSESETIMLRNAMFGAGKIMILLEQYEKAIATFNMAATRYNEPISLDALLQIAIAYRNLNRPNEAISALNRAEMLLQQFEESGTIPKENDWKSKIQVQKTILS